MAIVIKKKVTLEFLGEEYKDFYLTFSSMPLREYEELLPKIEESSKDGKKSLALMKEILDAHFLEGKFEAKDVGKDDLPDFDIDTLTKCFEALTGNTSPKS